MNDPIDPIKVGDKPVFLVGFMGAGKSSVGLLLAKKLSFSYLDMDHFIEQQNGMDIVAIFSEQGESAFRLMEKEALYQVADHPRSVISTGGGIVMDAGNRHILSAALTVWLDASVDTLWERLLAEGMDSRPLLRRDEKSAYEQLYAARAPLYRQVADVRVDVTHRSISDTVQWIYDWLQTKNACTEC